MYDFLTAPAAYQLSDVTKTEPQYASITPRWMLRMLEWKGLETGVFRLNRVREGRVPLDMLATSFEHDLHHQQDLSHPIPEGFVDYEDHPREITLSSISSIVKISTRVSDLYSSPYDQSQEQIRLSIESLREYQESQMINSKEYGLLTNAVPSQRIGTRSGPPTPDDLDELIVKVWKEPSFFVAHPRAIAAFGRECTRRGVPPVILEHFGSPFLSWRGIPLLPSDKIPIVGDSDSNANSGSGRSSILLVRTGEARQGAIGLFQKDLPGEYSEGVSVRFMGIDNQGVGNYLLFLYCSCAMLTDDAVAVLEDVDVGHYHQYHD